MYFYGYCTETQRAWRVSVDDPKRRKEMTDDFFDPGGHAAPGEDPVSARWFDGHEAALTELTVQLHREMKRRNGKCDEGASNRCSIQLGPTSFTEWFTKNSRLVSGKPEMVEANH